MKLSNTYIKGIEKYITGRRLGGLHEVDGMTIVTNSVSLIIFTPYGDEEQIVPSDFTGIKLVESPTFKDRIWKYNINPYWEDRTISYCPMPITMFLEDIKADADKVRKENDISSRTKLYDESVTGNFYDVSVPYGGMWLNPELMYDVAKLISSKKSPVDIWIPRNKRHPAVIVGTNKYGTHLGFVLGTGKNFRKD